MDEPHRITTQEELRAIVGEPNSLTEVKVLPELDETATDFIRLSPFLVLATANASGDMDVSPKGDPPGFVRIEDPRTIVIPDRTGNKMALGHRNVLENAKVSAIFMVPGTPETLRIAGRAELTADPDLLESFRERGKPPVLAIRISIDEVFFHCPKAFMRSGLWQPDSWPERLRVSMGRILARRLGKGRDFEEQVDAAVTASREELARRM